MKNENQNMKTEKLGPQTQHHPYEFHVSGPRNVPTLNWRDIISSTWKDANYRRTVIACLIQAVYLLELDRQQNRTNNNPLAPKWFAPFKYKLIETLIDDRDGSIFGAIFEWDRQAALSDFILIKPSGAPRAILALRGTLLKTPTFRRDIEDDLRFLAWESLKGSVRFSCAFKKLKLICEKYGSGNVCVGGHSLGAGFALQIGKELAKEGIFVEAHLFNPPSVSLKNMGERVGGVWKRFRSMIPLNYGDQTQNDELKLMINKGLKQWVPNLYVNNSDYICCYYSERVGGEERGGAAAAAAAAGGKVFVVTKGKQRFLEAHGLEQWWGDDVELEMAVNDSKLICRQLKSLYSLPPEEQSPNKNL